MLQYLRAWSLQSVQGVICEVYKAEGKWVSALATK